MTKSDIAITKFVQSEYDFKPLFVESSCKNTAEETGDDVSTSIDLGK